MLNQGSGNTLQATIENTAGMECQTIPSANAVSLNAWQHIAVTYNDAGDRRIHFYVHGVETAYQQQPALTGTLASAADPLIIGNRGANDRGFQGIIDDVRIYNGILSAAEIQSLANQATPTPGPCHQYTPGSIIPSGYGVPWDMLSGANELLIQATCNGSSATIDLGKGNAMQYLYKTGYLFKTGGTSWSPITYTSTETFIAQNWFPKSATATLPLTSTELTQPSYVLGYICSWIGTGWKCGCRDSACTQSYWQIQSFKR